MKKLLLLLCFPIQLFSQNIPAKILAWEKQAKNITIIRDNWGIPHIYGKTDADAVFGLMYTQCEDDFKRVEMNYINVLGRSSEIKGEQTIYDDLYTKLVIDSAEAVKEYNAAPIWLRKLLQAWSDGIHFYLYKHPTVKTILLKEFKPWYPLMWTDGSISAISTGFLNARDVKNFYTNTNQSTVYQKFRTEDEEQTGSNGFAIAPLKSTSGSAMLYINPHVTFYFRPEVHMVSEEGLNAYGAVTWGQFFIYQGFNENLGWMHTSSNADVSDVYEEKVQQKDGKWLYEYEGKWLNITEKNVTVQFVKNNQIELKNILTYHTHHGPIMGKQNNKWLSVKSYNRHINGLTQSWLRTKANSFKSFKKVLDIRSNTSNNTVYADRDGNIAYWHGNYMPIRDTRFNWGKAVDGSIKATEYKGMHAVNEIVQSINPSNGWLQNCNSTPFTVAGENSPLKKNYPTYMAPDGENFRGINAVRTLSSEKQFTIEQLIAAGYNRKLPAFEILVPALLKAYDQADEAIKNNLKEPIQELRNWDYTSAANSIATTLAIEWAQFQINRAIQQVYIEEGEDDQVAKTKKYAATANPAELINSFYKTIESLTKAHGTWKMTWGNLNRYQRLSGDVDLKYDDNKESLASGFASATWGSLPSYNSRYMNGTKKRYGFNGNSFICAVEFGKKIKAKSLIAGGNTSNTNSPWFENQAGMYLNGQFKDVLFYREDVEKKAAKTYRPGE